MIHPRYIFLCLFSLHGLTAQAEEPAALPQPLSLQHALSLAEDEQHPAMLETSALLELSDAELQRAESKNSFRADLQLQAAYIEPSPLAPDQSQDDLIARLSIRKQLYDFGQSELSVASAREEYDGFKAYRQYRVEQRRIDITRRFFEVILSDLKYVWDNEALAIAYVRFDKLKQEHALSRISDIVLLKAENDYEEVRYLRYNSENSQRNTRALLAETLNRPGELPSDLTTPELQYHKREVPEYEELVNQALQQNVRLKLLEAQLEAANKRIQAARYQARPTLDAKLEVSDYSRESSSNDDWRAQLNLTIPLFEHQGIQADVAKARSTMLKQRAMLLDEQARVRQRVLELWQNIRLLKTRREQVQLALSYRELSLDRNRALYELEVATNLGDAMTAISEVRYQQAKTDFELALAWMELQLLIDNKIDTGDIQ